MRTASVDRPAVTNGDTSAHGHTRAHISPNANGDACARADSPATAHMFIVNPLRGGRTARLFSTHPPMSDRVARLEKMAYGAIE